eukprot:TRINITY_DN18632_c0_g1_i1.p1 TRINITY_DN18632_c0_g1~~TRINITY_DN18632_c0_g1_i1.p1  ORF type:complete len:367 (+),score=69.39 TRINITY_DN18632_c0_g1_i1:145-1245(+)
MCIRDRCNVKNLCTNEVMLPCLAITGLTAGALIHTALRPLVVGVKGTPWQKVAGTVSAAVCVGLVGLYSASVRTDIPHLENVQQTETSWSWFHQTAPCYIQGQDELTWVPRIDVHTGKIISQRGDVTRDGIESAKYAAGLRDRAIALEGPVYLNKTAAYFGGMPWTDFVNLERTNQQRLQPDQICSLEYELSVGESILTDCVVSLAAEIAPSETLAEGLTVLMPWLVNSSLGARLYKQKKYMSSKLNWAETEPEQGLTLLKADLAVRKAQLREIMRMEQGAIPGVGSAEKLESELTEAGVVVGAAKSRMRELGWTGAGSVRELDLVLIQGAVYEERVRNLKVYASAGAVLAAVVGLGACVGMLPAE